MEALKTKIKRNYAGALVKHKPDKNEFKFYKHNHINQVQFSKFMKIDEDYIA
jgi:hypothetical protein